MYPLGKKIFLLEIETMFLKLDCFCLLGSFGCWWISSREGRDDLSACPHFCKYFFCPLLAHHHWSWNRGTGWYDRQEWDQRGPQNVPFTWSLLCCRLHDVPPPLTTQLYTWNLVTGLKCFHSWKKTPVMSIYWMGPDVAGALQMSLWAQALDFCPLFLLPSREC